MSWIPRATLDTHCGRKSRIDYSPRECLYCSGEFIPKYAAQRYCSQPCGVHSKGPRDPHPERRKVERPSYKVLIEETQRMGFSAVGRKYGVSDNSVRKWLRWYEAAAERRDAAWTGGSTASGSTPVWDDRSPKSCPPE